MNDRACRDPVDPGLAEVDLAAPGVGRLIYRFTEGDQLAGLFWPVTACIKPQLPRAVQQVLDVDTAHAIVGVVRAGQRPSHRIVSPAGVAPRPAAVRSKPVRGS